MSVTTRINKTRIQGDNYPMQFTYLEDGVAANISGNTFSLQVATSAGVDVFTVAGAIVVAGDGTFQFTFTNQFDIAVGTYNYEVQMIKGGKEYTIVQGELELERREHDYV